MSSSNIIRNVHTFLVTADETEGCQKLGFRGKYKLEVGFATVQLLHCDSNREVTHWPIYQIRNFGFTSKSFFLYAGTRCKTGEGKFIFLTNEGKTIVQCMSLQVDELQSQSEHEKKGLKEEKQNKKEQENVKSKGQASHNSTDNEYTETRNFPKLSIFKVKEDGSEKIVKKFHGDFMGPGGSETEHNQLHKNVGGRMPGSEYKQIVSKENYKGLQTMATENSILAVSPLRQDEEEDYYNYDLYSHLHNDAPRIQENEYGMASCSAPVSTEEEQVYENTVSSHYDYISL